MTSREEIAWAAGFFEGEGTIMLVRNKCAGSVAVGQKFRGPLDRLQSLFGGSVIPVQKGHHWQWSLYDPVEFLEAILPHITKGYVKKEASVFLAYHASDDEELKQKVAFWWKGRVKRRT